MQGQKAHAQTLAIARQKHLNNMLHAGPSIDPGAGVDAETTGNKCSCPSVGSNNPVDMEVENSPVLSDPLPLEDPGNGEDPNDLSDGGDTDEGSNVTGDVKGPVPVAPTRHEHAKEEEESNMEVEGPREGRNKAVIHSTQSGRANLDGMSSGTAGVHGPG
ncbi:hypothetical protein H4582DRAFT_2053980 [Lactarius indigo]|nr:hypothetical protein H4582DRAFT_2053980 [Lactarius indigo]